jgi:CspA family cold shock protein
MGINIYFAAIINHLSNHTMSTGTVKFFNATKGYGFITVDETNQEVFVHATGLVDQVSQNDKVSFEVEEGKKGPNAVNVKKA